MTEEPTQDGAAVRFPPPLVPVIALALGFAAQWLVGPLPNTLLGASRFAIGGGLIVAGLALLAFAFGLFRETGQDPAPWESSPELIAAGVYRWTRNPMYVSMGLMQAGIGVLAANMWIVVLVPVAWGVIYLIAIRHEEAYLERKFGNAYTEYKRAVRRWI